MQRPPDLNERLARIEEKMATREDVAALRVVIESRGPPIQRWLGGAVFAAVLAVGFLTLVLIFTRGSEDRPRRGRRIRHGIERKTTRRRRDNDWNRVPTSLSHPVA